MAGYECWSLCVFWMPQISFFVDLNRGGLIRATLERDALPSLPATFRAIVHSRKI